MSFKAVITEGDEYTEFYIRKIRTRGARPYTTPLPYNMAESKVVNKRVVNTADYSVGADIPLTYPALHAAMHPDTCLSTNQRNAVWNKALNKLGDKLEYVQNMFEAWYERREAYTMLGSCIRAVHTFVKRWKDPKYWKAMRKAWKTNIKDPTSLPQAWLLWNFAVKPLVLTIQDLAELLSSEFPMLWVDAASGTDGTAVPYSFKEPNSAGLYGDGLKLEVKFKYIVKHGVRVTSLNPNAQLANIMGLTTPFSTAISVIPWGWAVNYFVNVSDFVSNLEVRFPGINIDSSYSTIFHSAEMTGEYHTGSIMYPYVLEKNEQGYYNAKLNPSLNGRPSGKAVHMTRTTSTAVPKFKLEFGYPALGTTQFANLASAIALTMHGAEQERVRKAK